MARGPRTKMSAAHREAIAASRREAYAVQRYLHALTAHGSRPTRRATSEQLQQRITHLGEELGTAGVLRALALRQERRDLEAELASRSAADGFADVEADFIASARAYGDRKHISYATWREAGVPAATLAEAGITRQR